MYIIGCYWCFYKNYLRPLFEEEDLFELLELEEELDELLEDEILDLDGDALLLREEELLDEEELALLRCGVGVLLVCVFVLVFVARVVVRLFGLLVR